LNTFDSLNGENPFLLFLFLSLVTLFQLLIE